MNKSSTEQDITSGRRMQQLNTAIEKDLAKSEKAMLYSLDKGRMAKHVAFLEARGFSVERHPEANSLFIRKQADSGEVILIDFWDEEVSTVHAHTPSLLCHCSSLSLPPSTSHSQADGQIAIVIEIARPSADSGGSSGRRNHMYFKCVAEEGLLGLQALELAPPELLRSGERGGIYGYPFDRDVSDEMKVRGA